MSDYLKIARELIRKRPLTDVPDDSSLESILKGSAIELWSDALGERLWLVADEADAIQLAQPRGRVYTGAEARMMIRVPEPATAAEIHTWKRRFDATLRQVARAQASCDA
jgi:hypothetical protein